MYLYYKDMSVCDTWCRGLHVFLQAPHIIYTDTYRYVYMQKREGAKLD